MKLSRSAKAQYDETISSQGFRFTRQRREVYDALMARRDHPTAVEVFIRVKNTMPTISLATVYNCLETLTECGLVKQVNHDRAPSRYCPNLASHGHFFCEECDKVIDVPLPEDANLTGVLRLPSRCIVKHQELSLSGLCPECATRKKPFTAKSIK